MQKIRNFIFLIFSVTAVSIYRNILNWKTTNQLFSNLKFKWSKKGLNTQICKKRAITLKICLKKKDLDNHRSQIVIEYIFFSRSLFEKRIQHKKNSLNIFCRVEYFCYCFEYCVFDTAEKVNCGLVGISCIVIFWFLFVVQCQNKRTGHFKNWLIWEL